MDRYYSFRTELKEFYEKENSIIITDRYTTANAVHQISKLPEEQWDSFLDWLYDFEFTKLGLPCPDKVIFLEMTPEISARLVEHRANVKDIHENAHDYMAHCYTAGMYAAKKLDWDIIKCYENGEPLSIEEIMDCWNEMAFRMYSEEIDYKKGAFAFIKMLKEKGIRTAICTSNSKELVTAVGEHLGFMPYFDTIITSCEVGAGKPAPDIYLEAARRVGALPEECLVFEDIVMGLTAGKRAGMKLCAVEDPFSADQRAEKKAMADYYIEDYLSLLE